MIGEPGFKKGILVQINQISMSVRKTAIIRSPSISQACLSWTNAGILTGINERWNYDIVVCDLQLDQQSIIVANQKLANLARILLVYETQKLQSFLDIAKWADETQQLLSHIKPDDILLVGLNCESESPKLSQEEGAALAQKHGWQFHEACLKTGQNLDRIFTFLNGSRSDKVIDSNTAGEQKHSQDEVRETQKNKTRERKFYKLRIFIKFLNWSFCLGLIVLGYQFMILERSFDYSQPVEEGCKDLSTLKQINDQIYPLTDELSYQPFFKFFKISLKNHCPLNVSKVCSNKKCMVSSFESDEARSLAQSTQANEEEAIWRSEQSERPSEWIWHVEELEDEDRVSIDLRMNPESYTGQQGQQIWYYIYNENCFSGWNTKLSRQERALINTLSGLHASISTQLSEFYIDWSTNRTEPNISIYFQRVGNYPERIKNLFFLYAVLMRSVELASPEILRLNVTTNSPQEDERARQLLNELFQILLTNSMAFDEKSYFNGITQDTKRQYNRYVYNISRLMDCVDCQKCKVYGKMQSQGLATAFKILFSDNPRQLSGSLKRYELVALINTFGKISSSVKSVQLMFERRVAQQVSQLNSFFLLGGVLIAILTIVQHVSYRKDKSKNQKHNMSSTEDQRRKANINA